MLTEFLLAGENVLIFLPIITVHLLTLPLYILATILSFSEE